MPNGRDFPPLFNFTQQGKGNAMCLSRGWGRRLKSFSLHTQVVKCIWELNDKISARVLSDLKFLYTKKIYKK